MTRPKIFIALAFGTLIFAATAFGQGSTENSARQGSMMEPGGVHEQMTQMMDAMTRMMDGCARMMQMGAHPMQGQTAKPAPGTGQTQ